MVPKSLARGRGYFMMRVTMVGIKKVSIYKA